MYHNYMHNSMCFDVHTYMYILHTLIMCTYAYVRRPTLYVGCMVTGIRNSLVALFEYVRIIYTCIP